MMKARGAGVRWGTFALSVAAAFAASPGVKARAAASIEKPMIVEALFVSDIHFEPFWDPAKAARLKAAPVSEWSAILAEPSSADQAA